MSLLAYWATVADQAILSLCIQIMLTWIVLRALKSSSAGFCRDRLCKIRRAPRRAQRFGGDGLTLRRGSGRDADLIQTPHGRFDSRIDPRTMLLPHLQAGKNRDTDQGKVNSSESCLVFINRLRGIIEFTVGANMTMKLKKEVGKLQKKT